MGLNSRGKVKNQGEMRRLSMVKHQIAARGVKGGPVLAAMEQVPRHLFVGLDHQESAYDDCPLPLGFGQTISQPYMVAYMSEQLGLEKTSKVLEIGTGCGYQTAILAELAGLVYSIEYIKELQDIAKVKLGSFEYDNIHFKVGDGFYGWEEAAPFDAILIAAASPQVPMDLVAQLKVGGILIFPLGI